MISKMNFYGVQGTALDWFTSYLSNGTPQCLVNGSLLRICSLKCRVPQCLFFFFWRGLYTEGSLSFKIGWAYIWREIYISKLIGLAYSCSYSPWGCREGRFYGGFFVFLVWGACIWRGLQSVFSEFYGIEISDNNLLLKLLRHRTPSLSHSFLMFWKILLYRKWWNQQMML